MTKPKSIISGKGKSCLYSQTATVSTARKALTWTTFNGRLVPILSQKRQVTSGTVGSYAVSSKAADPATAVAWIKFVTDSENSVKLNKTVGYLPPLKDASTYYKGEDAYQTLLERASHVQVDPIFPSASQAYIILAEEAQAVMTGDKTPEAAAQSMQDRIDAAKTQLEKQ